MAARLPRRVRPVRPRLPQGVPRLRRPRPPLGGVDAQAGGRACRQGRRRPRARRGRQRRRAAAGGLLRRPRDLPRLLHRAAGARRGPAHLRHHAVVRPAPRRTPGRDPGGLRPPRRAHGAGVLDAGPGRADLVDGADEPAAPPRGVPRPHGGLGGPALRPGRPRDADPLRPHPGGDGRGVRTGRAVGGVLRAALRRRRPRRPVCPPRHRPARPRPGPRRQRLTEGRRRFRTPWWRGSPGTTAGCTTRSPRASRTSTSARSGRAAATCDRSDKPVDLAEPTRASSSRPLTSIAGPSRAGATPRPRPRSAGRSPRAAGPRRAGTWGR